MLLIDRVQLPNPVLTSMVDATLITLAAIPIIYFLFIKPLLQERINRLHISDRLEHNKLYDPLTDLPNSTLFAEQVKYEIKNSDRTGRPFALILLRVHHLSEVNASFGRQQGDALLRCIAQRLQKGLRNSDTISRYDGNVFCILMPGVDEGFAYIISRKIQLLLETDVVIEDMEIVSETSGGIVVYPKVAFDHYELIRLADIASHRRRIGHNSYHLYESSNDMHARRHLSIYTSLKQAVKHEDGLRLHYQPKIDLATGAIESVEALARWRHPELGEISPAEFIPLAEQTVLIRPFTWKIIEIALRDLKYWLQKDLYFRVAINLSARNLYDPALAEMLPELIQKHGLDIAMLELEVTESALMDDAETSTITLCKLKDTGFTITIDDFGTGYSSLAYLCDIPSENIKIDQSFIKPLLKDDSKISVVRAIIELAHNLNMRVTAEGVENQETYDLLKTLGCDIAQGYFISKPLAPDALLEFSRTLSNARPAESQRYHSAN